jgi:hypothetical protein
MIVDGQHGQQVIEDHISERELKVLRTAEESEREQLRMFAREVSPPSETKAQDQLLDLMSLASGGVMLRSSA